MPLSSLNTTSITSLVDLLGTTPRQRANQFAIKFTSSKLRDQPTKDFIASMVQIPSRTILYYPDTAGSFEPPFRVPLQHQFDDKFIVEFLVDETHEIRKFIESWMDDVGTSQKGTGPFTPNNTFGSVLFGAANDACTTTMIVTPIKSDTSGAASGTYTFYDVWPKLILPSEMSSDNPEFLKLMVDFNYRYYRFA